MKRLRSNHKPRLDGFEIARLLYGPGKPPKSDKPKAPSDAAKPNARKTPDHIS